MILKNLWSIEVVIFDKICETPIIQRISCFCKRNRNYWIDSLPRARGSIILEVRCILQTCQVPCSPDSIWEAHDVLRTSAKSALMYPIFRSEEPLYKY